MVVTLVCVDMGTVGQPIWHGNLAMFGVDLKAGITNYINSFSEHVFNRIYPFFVVLQGKTYKIYWRLQVKAKHRLQNVLKKCWWMNIWRSGSHGSQKRYSAFGLLSGYFNKETLWDVLYKYTWMLIFYLVPNKNRFCSTTLKVNEFNLNWANTYLRKTTMPSVKVDIWCEKRSRENPETLDEVLAWH